MMIFILSPTLKNWQTVFQKVPSLYWTLARLRNWPSRLWGSFFKLALHYQNLRRVKSRIDLCYSQFWMKSSWLQNLQECKILDEEAGNIFVVPSYDCLPLLRNSIGLSFKGDLVIFNFFTDGNKVIIEESSGEGSLMEQDTIENVS